MVDGMVAPGVFFLVFAAVALGLVVIVALLLHWFAPSAQFDDRPWPTPPRFAPGKLGEFMAEDELRRRIAERTTTQGGE